MSVLPNLIYIINAIPVEIPAICVLDNHKQILKFIWRCKRHKIANTTLKNKVGRLSLPDFKTYHKATVIKVVWYW